MIMYTEEYSRNHPAPPPSSDLIKKLYDEMAEEERSFIWEAMISAKIEYDKKKKN